MRRLLISLLLILSLVLLAFAVTEPALTIEAKIAKSELAKSAVEAITEDSDGQSRYMLHTLAQMLGLDRLEGHIEAYGKTRSIWGTVVELYQHNNVLVAVLVAMFSVVVPLFKSTLQFAILLLGPRPIAERMQGLSAMLSKWSMADVFVLALIITYLGGNADGHFGQLVIMQAQLHQGFWLFLGYCLVSIITSILLHHQRQIWSRA
ncbi:paraquat-inducible protein A [Pseudoalteromonas sp. T1lg48]|uniref:paraquat-inducible protein A n=1 Tax=Pseudoalteromonas sp. T1lg48 TaxID=2077100 RepID=UPI000CF6CDEF|nr:paraquat-inducible protein A [Pseudoalteromonas sp. T1lg48]